MRDPVRTMIIESSLYVCTNLNMYLSGCVCAFKYRGRVSVRALETGLLKVVAPGPLAWRAPGGTASRCVASAPGEAQGEDGDEGNGSTMATLPLR